MADLHRIAQACLTMHVGIQKGASSVHLRVLEKTNSLQVMLSSTRLHAFLQLYGPYPTAFMHYFCAQAAPNLAAWKAASGPYWVVAVGPSSNSSLAYDWAIVSAGPPKYPGLLGCRTTPPFKEPVLKLHQKLHHMFTGVWDGVKNVWDDVSDAFDDMWDKITGNDEGDEGDEGDDGSSRESEQRRQRREWEASQQEDDEQQEQQGLEDEESDDEQDSRR